MLNKAALNNCCYHSNGYRRCCCCCCCCSAPRSYAATLAPRHPDVGPFRDLIRKACATTQSTWQQSSCKQHVWSLVEVHLCQGGSCSGASCERDFSSCAAVY